MRTDVTYDPSFGSGGAWGGELGVGGALLPLDDAGLWGAYRTHPSAIQRQLGFYVEEHYVNSTAVIPFIGVGAGYTWLSNRRDDVSDDGLLIRFQTGAKLMLNDNLALAGNVLLSWADGDLWITRTSTSDTNIGFSLGLRFYY